MALTPVPGSSQVALLERSDASLADQGQRTALAFRQFAGDAQAIIAVQDAENFRLRELLVAAEARPRELTLVHQAEMRAALERIEIADRRVLAIQEERDATVQRAEQHVVAEMAARVQEAAAARAQAAASQQELLLARQELAAFRADSAQQAAAALAERDAAVLAATQRGDAQVAALRQTAEEARARHVKAIALVQLEEQDTCKLQKFLYKLPTHRCYSPRGVPFTAQVEKLQKLIDARLARAHDSVMDSALQEADTQQLVSLAAFLSGCPIPRDREAMDEILRPLIIARQTRTR